MIENHFDLSSGEMRQVAREILDVVQEKVMKTQPDRRQVEIVQAFEHEYMLELIGWLLHMDGLPGPPRRHIRSLLDIGAGWGTTMNVGVEMGIDILGIDSIVLPSPGRVEWCDVLDISRLRAIDLGQRDLLVCTEVLEHLSFDPTESFAEIIKQTDASWIFISVPHGRYAEHWPMGRIRYWEMPKWKSGVVDPIHPYVHRKPWEMEELDEFLGQFGFKIVGRRQTRERNIVLGRRIRGGLCNTSGFARASGCSDEIGNYLIPSSWWSRKYEYQWAAQFCESRMVVLDVGCGIVHPFKKFLADTCREAIGMDMDPSIKSINHQNLKVIHHDATMPWTMLDDSSLDGVFCISMIEHIIPTHRASTILSEARRVIKPDGFVAITFDVPDVTIRWFERMMEMNGLRYDGDVDHGIPPDVLVQRLEPPYPRPGPPGPNKKRMVFSAILRSV